MLTIDRSENYKEPSVVDSPGYLVRVCYPA